MNSHKYPFANQLALVIFSFSLCLAHQLIAEDRAPIHWRHIHGVSQANAYVAEADWLKQWKPTVLWRANVGTGFSAVVVDADRVLSVGNSNNIESVYCLSAQSGEEIWKFDYPQPLNPDLYKGGPNATPTIHDGRVYMLSRLGDVFCLDLVKGTVIWERHLKKEEQIKDPKFGFSGSPLVHKTSLILHAGDAGIALDLASGKTLWLSGQNKSSYANPVPYKKDAVLIFHGKGVAARSVEEGTQQWNFPWKTNYGVNSATPIIDGDHVFITSGYGMGCALLDLSSGQPQQVWKSKVFECQIAGPVLVDGHLYGVSAHVKKPGELRCVELSSGKLLWQQEGFGHGSVIAVGQYLIVLSEDGQLVMAELQKDSYVELGRMKVLDQTCWTQPTIANGHVYVRNSAGEIVCLRMY
ncbi:MAG: PQQ-binding-like beta-propeller repeat protein [Planctomycetes bacterium]|nr:PQQ-binding-like beta-propeller repeat protein [Planctomycetota bacterium]